MALQYRIYSNAGDGGDVDLSTPLATVSGLTYTTAALLVPGDYTFIVLTYDTVSGLESLDQDARARLVISAGNVDVSNRPAPPLGVALRALAGGEADLSWSYPEGWSAVTPDGFKIWVTAGTGPVNFGAAPVATVPMADIMLGFFRRVLTGLSDGADYVVGIRAYLGVADDGNTESYPVRGDSTGPDAPDELVIDATWEYFS